jgi:hypothetical protein
MQSSKNRGGPGARTRWIAERQYIWRPKLGPARPVRIQLGSPQPSGRDWSCRLLVTGLPAEYDKPVYGIDAIQSLELALVHAGRVIASTPEFQAGQIEHFDKPIREHVELFLPLPMNSLQSTLHDLRHYFVVRRKRRVEREMLANLLSIMEDVEAHLAVLAAHLPIVPRRRSAIGRWWYSSGRGRR